MVLCGELDSSVRWTWKGGCYVVILSLFLYIITGRGDRNQGQCPEICTACTFILPKNNPPVELKLILFRFISDSHFIEIIALHTHTHFFIHDLIYIMLIYVQYNVYNHALILYMHTHTSYFKLSSRNVTGG